MDAFATAMLGQLQHPTRDIQFRLEMMNGPGLDCSCQDFLQLRPEEETLLTGLLRDRPAPTVLDVGCGVGRHLDFVRRQQPAAQLVGVEKANDLRQYCAARFPSAMFRESFADVPDDLRFDLVLLMGNGLGIFGDEQSTLTGLRRIHQLLNPGGVLVVESGNPFGNNFFVSHFTIRYRNLSDGPFPWRYASRSWLEQNLAASGYQLGQVVRSSMQKFFICVEHC
jgi:SAM-dependent methyltransferase